MLSYGAAVAINDEIPNLLGNLADVKPTILFAVPRIFNRIYDAVNKQIASKPGVIQSLVGNAITAATDQTLGNPVGLFGKLQLGIADRLVFEKVRQKFGGRLRYAVSGSAALSREVVGQNLEEQRRRGLMEEDTTKLKATARGYQYLDTLIEAFV